MSNLEDLLIAEWDPAAGPLDPPTYEPIGKVGSGTCRRGRSGIGPKDPVQAGTGSVSCDNSEGDVDPTVWHRNHPFRLRTAATTPILTGFSGTPQHDQSGSPFTAAVAVPFVDATDRSSRQQLTGAQIVTTYGAGMNPVKIGYVPHLIDVAKSYNFVGYLQEWAQLECGAFWVDTAGSPLAQTRYWRLQALADTVTPLVFSDADPLPSGAVRYLSREAGGVWELTAPDLTYFNRVEWTGTSGRQFSAQNVPSGWDVETLSFTDVACPADRWMEANATYLLEVYRQTNAFPRRLKVRLWPTDDDAIIETICALDIGHVVQVDGTPVGGTPQTWKLFVESIIHDWDSATPKWDVTLEFSSADAWETAWGTYDDYLLLDTDLWDGTKKWAP